MSSVRGFYSLKGRKVAAGTELKWVGKGKERGGKHLEEKKTKDRRIFS